MASLNPAESSLSGEHVPMVPVWITRFTVLEPAHCWRITRAASRAASAVLLYCVPNLNLKENPSPYPRPSQRMNSG